MRGSWRLNRTATYWPSLLWSSVFLSCSPGLLNQGPGAQPLLVLVFSTASYLQLVWSPNWLIGGLRAPSAGCWLSLPYLVSNRSGLQTDWISCALSYIIVQRPPSSCGRHNFALIQPVHGQGYNILIDRMHLLFTQVHFLFWQPSRVVGQYATLSLHYSCPVHWGCRIHWLLLCRGVRPPSTSVLGMTLINLMMRFQ